MKKNYKKPLLFCILSYIFSFFYSCKSMLKLIRWCRYFGREYKPIKNTLRLKTLIPTEPSTYNQKALLPVASKTNTADKCFICHDSSDGCELDGKVAYCQNCLYRKYLFLYGGSLVCWKCESGLDKNNYSRWNEKNWCQRCLMQQCIDSRIVVLDA